LNEAARFDQVFAVNKGAGKAFAGQDRELFVNRFPA
jgi:hypothetical protein